VDAGRGHRPHFRSLLHHQPPAADWGLSTMRASFRAHGAGIEISSKPGKAPASPPLPRHGTPCGRASGRHRPRVDSGHLSGTLLLAEDEPVIRGIARQMAERLGLRVLEAEDGEIAWRLFLEKQREIQVVILDLTMPRWVEPGLRADPQRVARAAPSCSAAATAGRPSRNPWGPMNPEPSSRSLHLCSV